MSTRVIDADVKAIIDTEVDTTPFIIVASLMIDQHLLGAGLPTNLLTELERWLAAHFVCIRDPRFTEVKTDTAGLTFQHGKVGTGLKSTDYGQTVLELDPTGILDVVTSTKPAYIRVD